MSPSSVPCCRIASVATSRNGWPPPTSMFPPAGDRRPPRNFRRDRCPAAPVRDAVLGGFADSLSDIYTLAIPIALLGFLVVVFLPELPLRTSVRGVEPVVTDGEATAAAFETSFNPDNADAPDLTASGENRRGDADPSVRSRNTAAG